MAGGGLRLHRDPHGPLDARRLRPRRHEHGQYVSARPDHRLRPLRLARGLRSPLDAQYHRRAGPALLLRRSALGGRVEPGAPRPRPVPARAGYEAARGRARRVLEELRARAPGHDARQARADVPRRARLARRLRPEPGGRRRQRAHRRAPARARARRDGYDDLLPRPRGGPQRRRRGRRGAAHSDPSRLLRPRRGRHGRPHAHARLAPSLHRAPSRSDIRRPSAGRPNERRQPEVRAAQLPRAARDRRGRGGPRRQGRRATRGPPSALR